MRYPLPYAFARSQQLLLEDDGGIIVLGGLLQDEYSGNQEKVPGVGDVPVFGNLFRTEQRTRRKSNLMVFLRPVVIRDASQSDAVSIDRYDLMRTKQQNAQPTQSSVVPINEAPIMPEVTTVPPPLNTWRPLSPPPATTAPSVR